LICHKRFKDLRFKDLKISLPSASADGYFRKFQAQNNDIFLE